MAAHLADYLLRRGQFGLQRLPPSTAEVKFTGSTHHLGQP
jgi:hypothetical protein